MLSTDALPSKREDSQHPVFGKALHVLTIHDYSHILDETIDNFQSLRGGGLSFIWCKSV